MTARWASCAAAMVLALSPLGAPRLALAQGTGNAAAVGHGIGSVDFDAPKQKEGPLPPDAAKIGMAAAPGLIKAAQLPCTLSEARFMFGATGADKDKAKVYEVACQEGLGYVIVAPEKAGVAPVIFDCMATAQPVGGRPNPMTCKLAGNADPAKGLSVLLARSGRSCTVDKGRYVGSTEDRNVYEVACQQGGGYILQAAKGPGGPTTANTCLAYGPRSNLRCILITAEQQQGAVASLIAASGKPCAMINDGFRGFIAADHNYVEVACSGGKGYLLEVDSAGRFAAVTDCLQAAGIGGGCTLTEAHPALVADDGSYSDLAKDTYSDLARKAGFDCAVSKYADFPPKANGAEVVELACSNRADGGVGVFPATGRPEVWDCLRAHAEGYTCSFSAESTAYGKLTTQLKAKGTNCAVNDARPYGRTAGGGDLIEVSCADGGPGWVLEYPPHAAEPSGALLNCVQAAASGGSSCQLAANKAHA